MLNELSTEERIAFIKIVNEFITVDSKLSIEEGELMDRYINEYKLTKDNVHSIDIANAMFTLLNASERIRKIVYFELLGIALIDGEYETSEIKYLDEMAIKFGISRSDKMVFANYYFDYENISKLSCEEKKIKLKNIFN